MLLLCPRLTSAWFSAPYEALSDRRNGNRSRMCSSKISFKSATTKISEGTAAPAATV